MATFTIHTFHEKINGTIIERGVKYFRKGYIRSITEKESQFWVARVEGTYNDYNVSVRLNNEDVSEWDCSCPFEGSVCKHVVAVLYDIRQKMSSTASPIAKSQDKHAFAPPQYKTPQSVEKAIEIIPEESPIPPMSAAADLYDYYTQELKDADKRLIKIGAMAWEALSASKYSEIYNGTFSNVKHFEALSSIAIKTKLERLRKAGFFTENLNGYRINTTFADLLCDKNWRLDKDLEHCIIPIQRRVDGNNGYFNYHHAPSDKLYRNLRFYYYMGDVHQLHQSIQLFSKNNIATQEEFKAYFLPHVFNRDRADAMQPLMLYFLLKSHFDKTLFNLQKPDAYYAYAVEKLATFSELHKYSMAKLLNEIALLSGDWTTVETIKPHLSPELQRHTEGVFQLLKANNHLLAKETAQFFTIIQKEVRTYAYNSASYDGLEGILMFLALLKVEETAATKLVKKQLSHLVHFSNDIHYRPAYQALDAVLKYMENDKRAADNILKNLVTGNDLNRFFFYLAAYWVDEKWLPLGLVKSYVLHLEKNGYHWLAYEMNVLLRRVEPKAVQWQNALDKTPLSINGNPIEPLLNAIPKTEAWQNALKALKTLGTSPKVVIENEKAAMQGSTRVVWLVDFEKLNFQPKEQTMGKKGWTNGRMASFAKLREPNNPSLSEQDAVIMQVSQKESWDRNSFDIQKALPHFIGHPLLFLEKNPDISIDLSEAKPVLVAKELKEGYQVGFTPPINPDLDVQVVKETPTRYKLVRLTPELKRIAVALGSDKLFVPAEGKDDLQLALGGLVNFVPIQSALDTEGGQKFKTVEADNRICIHLLPVGEGIHAELLVRPFPDSPPYFKPADGEAVVFADIKNETVKTTRDLKLEKNNHKKLLESVEILRDIKPTKGTYELAEVGECLDLLLQLQPHLEDKSIILEWPKGEKYKLQAIAGFDDFRLDIGSKQDWFSVDGQLRVNENMVFDMKKLLEWIERMKNGFIEISPGQFLALKKDFLRKLRDIAGVLVPQRDGTFQMHPLALPVMEGFTEALVNADLHERYTESLDRLKKAFNTDFRLPKNFNATLRPYQKEGYEWLCRCATWGVGACLADDMGLGKTVQALALVQRRSTEGATLVVAPASVCRNWVAEIEKFTPKLTPILFGEGDRAAMVEQAGKGDVVIVTYDLMAREADIFIQKQFTTIILDEAQAIKNRATRRSETAMQLQGGFKIAMSGTPLENHLGELWNLFQFINPGLLGSMEFFNERFASPIERYRDEERQSQLRNLVQPFILRRRKSEVLKELPAKTEIVLTVELSDKERAFYEALRRSVVEQLEAKLTEGGNEGQKQMQILAEIMRLRRAACHPKLVDDNVDIMESAKQKLFGDIVEELLENGHKALVFSQFVGHLTILKNYLDDKNIPYQYLDGSTPLKKRQERIEAFQKGEGAFFLISLKAGGVGLNLTEADFVLHMDPWWNPAVEDQATDRAHRIGQTKPVTVYRLVTEGTIEEKILKLHDQKRDLADSLLSGTDVSVRLSADELMDLIKKR